MSQITPAIATPTLPLPLELRTKILIELLTSENPLEFHLKSCPDPRNPILNNALLGAQFSTLCLVSKQMRSEGQEIFFEFNQWGLEICLVRTYPQVDAMNQEDRYMAMRNAWDRSDWGPAVTATRLNSATLIEEHWGEDALARMRNIRVDIRGQDESAHADTEAALKDLVDKLKVGGSLRKLLVNWSNRYGIGGGKCGTGRMKASREIRRAMRNEDGTREEPGHGRIAGWGKMERVLEPLVELRGLEEVTIMGCVTNQWAEYLEKLMTSREDIRKFERLAGDLAFRVCSLDPVVKTNLAQSGRTVKAGPFRHNI